MPLRIASLLAALLLIPFPASAKRKPAALSAARAAAQQHREKGVAAMAAGKDGEAAAELDLAIKGDPADEVSQHELGKLLFKQGKLPEAIARFQAAVKLEEKDALAWYNLAYASRKSQRFDQAAAAYRRYTVLSPDDPDGFFGYAESLRQAGKAAEAIAAYQTYLQKETRPSEKKWVERSKERIAELEVSSTGAAEKAVQEKDAADKAAATKLVQDKALAEEQKAAADRAAEEKVAAERASGQKPAAAAAAALEPEAQTGASAPTIAPLDLPAQVASRSKIAEGDRAFAAKDFRSALFAYQDAQVAEPKSLDAMLKGGQALARLGHDDEAIDQWNRALVLDPNNIQAHAWVAAAHERKAAFSAAGFGAAARDGSAGQQPAAAPLSQNPGPLPPPLVVVAPPSDEATAIAHYRTGVGLIREKRYDQAVTELDQTMALKPGFASGMIARGSAKVGLGRFQDAVADYTAAQRADPSLASPLFGLAEAYRGLGQAEKAADLYRQFASSTAPDAQPNLKTYALQSAQVLAPR